MKNLRLVSVSTIAFFSAIAASAAEREVTLVGEGQCSKCSLGKTPECGNAMVVKQDGKEVTYFLADNALSKSFHDNLCTDTKQIKVTGTVKEAGDHKEIAATKIELVKKN